jgi:predicted Rossmann-fold nucleotide-binding protein
MNDRRLGLALPILAVLGPSRASVEECALAERVGATAAGVGWVVLTGGGPGSWKRRAAARWRPAA